VTPLTLENSDLHFSIELPSGGWSLYSRDEGGGYVEGVRMGADYRMGSQPQRWAGTLDRTRSRPPVTEDSRHGPLQTLKLEKLPDACGLALTLEFAMPLERPFFLWRLTAHNRGAQPLRLDRLGLLAAGPASVPAATWTQRLRHLFWRPLESRSTGSVRPNAGPGQPAFFTNGWQSWGYTGALGAGDHYPYTRLGPFTTPMKVNRGTPQPRRPGHFASDMFGVLADRTHRTGMLVGFLSQVQQFGSVEAFVHQFAPSLKIWANGDGVALAPGDSHETDWAILQFMRLDDPDPLGPYMEAAGIEAEARVSLVKDTPVGWCSWYQFFDRVAEADVIANLEAVRQGQETLPLSLFQLDDGYQADVGDWFERNAKFPHDLRWLSDRIRAAGLTPGLWLAPFSAKLTAKIEQEHPDWILRHASGRKVNAGRVFDAWSHALDVTHPAVQSHVDRLIRTAVNEWGFSYLKLDFLYMGALQGKPHNPSLTRAQALRRALKLIREAAGPATFLLGCGCPLGSGIGVFDAMRISADVDPRWEPNHFGTTFFFKSEPDMPSARNAIRNMLTRAPMHRRWWLNDPDCLLARDQDTHLTWDEVISLASAIALSGGMFVLSDDMTRLSPERRRVIQPLLPVVGRAARAVDWMDAPMPEKLILPMSGPVGDWWVIGLFNWEDRPRTLSLNLKDFGLSPRIPWHALDFWNQRYYYTSSGEVTFGNIAAHGSVLLAVREAASDFGSLQRLPKSRSMWIGSDLHFTQGFEVGAWDSDDTGINLTVSLGRRASGRIWLDLSGNPKAVEVDGKRVQAERIQDQIYTIPVEIAGETRIWIGMLSER